MRPMMAPLRFQRAQRKRDDSRALISLLARQKGLVAATVIGGFLVGVAYRYVFNLPDERSLSNILRSGVHGVGLGLTVWGVQNVFAAGANSRLGARLRRLPVAVEGLLRALVLTLALVVVGVSLQALLYAEPYRLHWLTARWLTIELPRIVAVGFAMSLVIGVAIGLERLIGGKLLMSVLLGTYHRPSRSDLIVMFLDLAGSTRLAESLGEVRVHDLITRFFFDIDQPIADFGGAVHSYVGDEAIVSWPATDDPACNARSVACFFAIVRRIEDLAPDYQREFGVQPRFRAGLHLGPVVISECGDRKRQLAFFGDTMNVAARLCEHCRSIGRLLVISGDLLRAIAIPDGVEVAAGKRIEARGRQALVEAHVVEARV
jgi:class 3 adenylate cyclase